MALFDQAFKDEVRAKNDIVEVISSYVKLERRGSRYVGLCPFHSEKTPSFHVIPDLNIYHCFGCKASGDVFQFIQEREHLTFYEAVVLLARRAHIPLPRKERTPQEERAYRERREVYDALEMATRFFQKELQSPSGRSGYEYLRGRELTDETIRHFRLGWAPGYGRLFKALRGRFGSDVLQKAGLVVPRRDGSGFIDAFFGRVMFPITDLTGRVVGFGGRILEGDGPKYKNTADTLVFSKRKVLFGLAQAKQAIRAKNQAVLVEGYMDVIMPHQMGITNVVAPLGTALTSDQAQLLRRQAGQVVVGFDADTAGQMATLRGLETLYDSGCDVRILKLPQGKDPDEFIRAHGVEGFQRCIDEAIPLVEFKVRRAMASSTGATPEAKAKAVEAVAAVLASTKNDVLREEYVHLVANELASSPMDVRGLKLAIDRQMNRLLRQGFRHNRANSRNNMKDLGLPRSKPPQGGRSSPDSSQLAAEPRKGTRDGLVWRAERTLILLFLRNPSLLSRIGAALGEEPFTDSIHAAIYQAARDVSSAELSPKIMVARVLDALSDEDARLVVTEMAAAPLVSADPIQEADDCIEKIQWHRDSRRIADLENEMKTRQAAGEPIPEAVWMEWTQLQVKRKRPSKA